MSEDYSAVVSLAQLNTRCMLMLPVAMQRKLHDDRVGQNNRGINLIVLTD